MSHKASGDPKVALLILAFLVLAPAWVFLVSGVFHLVGAALRIGSGDEGWLVAMWELAFSFGATSIATLVASKARFGEKPSVRRLFLSSQVVVSTLFLGYLAIEVLSMLVRYGTDALAAR